MYFTARTLDKKYYLAVCQDLFPSVMHSTNHILRILIEIYVV